MTEKFIGYFRLVDACARAGCPVCRCNWHTWMLLEAPDAKSGAAIIYEDLIRVFLHRVRRLSDRAPSFRARPPRNRAD